MSFLGLVLVPAFGILYSLSSPNAVDPLWARLVLAGLFAALLGTSYRSRWVRTHYVVLLRGILYVLLVWFVVVTALNQFGGDYSIGLLLVYAVLIAVVGVGVESIQPVLHFAGFGFLFTLGALLLDPSPRSSPVILLACMVTVVLVGSVAIVAHLEARRAVKRREDRLRGLANSIPGVIFQLRPASDGGFRMQFVSNRAEPVLDLSPHPVDFFGRFLDRIPSEANVVREAVEEAAEKETSWHVEVPFEKKSGARVCLLLTATPEREVDTLVFNGVILDITERKAATWALQDRHDKMESLYTATSLLLTANSTEVVTGRTNAVLHDIFDFPVGDVALRENGSVVMKGGLGAEGADPDPWAGRGSEESLAERACESGETVIAEELQSSRAPDRENQVQSLAAVPIGNHGAIVVGQHGEDDFKPFDLRLLEVLASYVTVVLDGLDRRTSG